VREIAAIQNNRLLLVTKIRPQCVATWVFVAAYMVVCALLGVAAYAGALAAEAIAAHAALSPATAARIGGAVLIVAGFYQLCRTPISFIMTSWRDGTTGASAWACSMAAIASAAAGSCSSSCSRSAS
jgi:predicted metal-binding membrane protein